MTSIFNLKKSMSLEKAATYLSGIVDDESVTEVDLMELALDGELVLSLSLPGRHWVTPYNENAARDALSLVHKSGVEKGTPEYRARLLACLEYAGLCVRHDNEGNEICKLGPDFRDGLLISRVWDLSMLGAERELIADIVGSDPSKVHCAYGDTRAPNNHPIILRDIYETNFLAGLFDSENDCAMDGEMDGIGTERELELVGYGSSTVQQFPLNSRLVIRQANLQAFINQKLPADASAVDPCQSGRALEHQNGSGPSELETLPDDFRLLYEALGDLPDLDVAIAAWRKYWKHRSPEDVKPWPENKEVVGWVKGQMENPSNVGAKRIAKIIRPRWAPVSRQKSPNN